MSEYEKIPQTPNESSFLGHIISGASAQVDNIDKQNKGVILENGNLEQAILDLAMDGNPVGSLAKLGTSELKEEACSPTQIQSLDSDKRTSGIPILQGVVLGVEQASSLVLGRDIELNGTLSAAKAIDRIAKPIATGGASLVADSVYEAGRNATDAAQCAIMGKEIELPYYGPDEFQPGQYPYDVTVTAQSTETFNPNAQDGGFSAEDLQAISSMYDTSNTINPSGQENPNIFVKPGQNTDPAPQSMAALNVEVSRRPSSMSGPSM